MLSRRKGSFEAPVDLGLNNLSLASILNRVIARSTSFILAETAKRLREGALYGDRILKLKEQLSTREPTEASLIIQLTSSSAIKVVQEPVTGRFAVLQANNLNTRMERDLNSLTSPATEAASRVANLRCVSVQEDFEMHARSAGWEMIRSLHLDRETLQRFFPKATLRISFLRRKSWAPEWVLALTTSLMGDAIWVAQTAEKKLIGESANQIAEGRLALRVALRLPAKGLRALLIDSSFRSLANIERAAVGMISQYLNTRQLTINGIPHKLKPSSSVCPALQTARLSIRLPENTPGTLSKGSSIAKRSCRKDTVVLDYRGIDFRASSGIHIGGARIRKGIAGINELAASLSSEIAVHSRSNTFAFRLTTPVGTTTIPTLLQRLSVVERLFHFLSILQYGRLPCEIISLTRLRFTYNSDPRMCALIDFTDNKLMHVYFDSSSPHVRVQDALNTIFRAPEGGLAQVLTHLKTTVPLLRQLLRIEEAHHDVEDKIDVLPRSAEWYELRYHDPKGRIDICLRNRRHEVKWFVRHLAAPKGEPTNEKVEIGMKELLKGKGEGWLGLKTGIAASVTGVEELLRRIDGVFRSARGNSTKGAPMEVPMDSPKVEEEKKPDPNPKNPRKRKAEDVVVLD